MACAPNDVLSSNPLVVSAGDFVTFFHELKQADYLTACLMHKHFDSVRHRALNAINRSFRLPQPGGETPLPLRKLIPMLCLEDIAEARAMVEHYGIETRGDNLLLRAPVTCALLNRDCRRVLLREPSCVLWVSRAAAAATSPHGVTPRATLSTCRCAALTASSRRNYLARGWRRF